VPPSPVPEAMAGKVAKTLDAAYDSGPNEIVLTASDLLDTLRKPLKGSTSWTKSNNLDDQAKLAFKETIPLERSSNGPRIAQLALHYPRLRHRRG